MCVSFFIVSVFYVLRDSFPGHKTVFVEVPLPAALHSLSWS